MSNFRITTNGLFRTYRKNLYKNNQKLGDSMTKVQTQRNFNTYAEDPASAAKAWRLRRSYWLTGDQIDNNNYIINKFESAYSAMATIVDGDATNGELGLNGILTAIEGVGDTAGASRNALGEQLIRTAENMVSMMNSKYGDEFIFAGADNANIPFAWQGDRLFYRGVDVGTEQAKLPEDFGLTSRDFFDYNLTSSVLEDADKATMPKPLSKDEFDVMQASGNKYFKQYGSYESYQRSYVDQNRESKDKNLIKLSTEGYTDADYAKAFAEAEELYEKFSAQQGNQIDLRKAHLDKPLSVEEFAEWKYPLGSYEEYSKRPENAGKTLGDYNAEKLANIEKVTNDTGTDGYSAYRKAYVDGNRDSDDPTLVRLKNAKAEGTDYAAAFAEAEELYKKLNGFKEYMSGYESRNPFSYETGVENCRKLEKMSNETTYVDIGLGEKESDRGEMIPGSAFNSSISGLEFLGYGEHGNLALIVRELGNIFCRADANTGSYKSDGDAERASELLDELQAAVRYSQGQHVQLSADSQYLRANLDQLRGNKERLDEQIVDTEDMEMADAITQMTWTQYCYNAALRIGNELLSQSLLDYMR